MRTRTGRLSCGSLRHHDEHQWTGQNTGLTYTCPGVRGVDPEASQRADRRLMEENTGVTDHWREG